MKLKRDYDRDHPTAVNSQIYLKLILKYYLISYRELVLQNYLFWASSDIKAKIKIIAMGYLAIYLHIRSTGFIWFSFPHRIQFLDYHKLNFISLGAGTMHRKKLYKWIIFFYGYELRSKSSVVRKICAAEIRQKRRYRDSRAKSKASRVRSKIEIKRKIYICILFASFLVTIETFPADVYYLSIITDY